MTNGKRNRSAGQGWERELAELFRTLGFPHVVTSRSESKSRDDAKVDLMNKDERRHGPFLFNVQAKNTVGHLPYAKLLSEMPEEQDLGVVNVIIHKQTKRVKDKFVTQGKFSIMPLEQFLVILQLAMKSGLTVNYIKSSYDQLPKTVEQSTKGRVPKAILPKARPKASS
jgi:hypothetical protein